jgi:hypothetical protein
MNATPSKRKGIAAHPHMRLCLRIGFGRQAFAAIPFLLIALAKSIC